MITKSKFSFCLGFGGSAGLFKLSLPKVYAPFPVSTNMTEKKIYG